VSLCEHTGECAVCVFVVNVSTMYDRMNTCLQQERFQIIVGIRMQFVD